MKEKDMVKLETLKSEDFAGNKKKGYLVQRDPKYFTLRTRLPGGEATPHQLRELARITEKYTKAGEVDAPNAWVKVKLTTVQDFQIPYVEWKDKEAITKEMVKINMPPGSCSATFRNVTACPAVPECIYGNSDTQKLARRMDKKYFGMFTRHKFKASIAGCPNSCVFPQLRDFGLMAVIRPEILENCTGCEVCVKACPVECITINEDKLAVIDYGRCTDCAVCLRCCPLDAIGERASGYNIHVGGNVGKFPRFADKIAEFVTDDEAFKILDNTLKYFNKYPTKVRIGRMIDEVGLEEFKKHALKGVKLRKVKK
jgi:dissimilatory sulfite reductase (desulfoviridin) alpha/beta subunit